MQKILTLWLGGVLLLITAVRTQFGLPPPEDSWTGYGPEIGSPGDGLYEDKMLTRPVDGTHAYLDKFRAIFPER